MKEYKRIIEGSRIFLARVDDPREGEILTLPGDGEESCQDCIGSGMVTALDVNAGANGSCAGYEMYPCECVLSRQQAAEDRALAARIGNALNRQEVLAWVAGQILGHRPAGLRASVRVVGPGWSASMEEEILLVVQVWDHDVIVELHCRHDKWAEVMKNALASSEAISLSI